MTYAGKLSQKDLLDYVRPAYENYHDVYDFDINPAKVVLVNFITMYCRTFRFPRPPVHIDNYRMSVCGRHGISMLPGNNKSIKYMFCMKTGNVYVGEVIGEVLDFVSENIAFDSHVKTYNNEHNPSYISTILLGQPKQ